MKSWLSVPTTQGSRWKAGRVPSEAEALVRMQPDRGPGKGRERLKGEVNVAVRLAQSWILHKCPLRVPWWLGNLRIQHCRFCGKDRGCGLVQSLAWGRLMWQAWPKKWKRCTFSSCGFPIEQSMLDKVLTKWRLYYASMISIPRKQIFFHSLWL